MSSAGRRRCSTVGFSSRPRSSMPNIRTSRCRARRRADTVGRRASRPSAASRPMPARRASAASSSRPTLALAQDFATSGDRLNLAGSLGYLDAKYHAVHHSTIDRGSVRYDVVSANPQDPEHAQVDAERHARLRHAAVRRPAGCQHDRVVPQREPAVRDRHRRSSTSRASRCGMRISSGARAATATSSASTART